jgi:hypothetical protein
MSFSEDGITGTGTEAQRDTRTIVNTKKLMKKLFFIITKTTI